MPNGQKKMQKTFIRWWKCGEGRRGEGRRGSRKEHIRTGQVTDRERSTNIHVMDV